VTDRREQLGRLQRALGHTFTDTGLLELARSSNMMVIEGLSPIQVYLILAFVSMILEGILGYFGAVAGNKISDKLIKAGVK